jgi:hypothetical protein
MIDESGHESSDVGTPGEWSAAERAALARLARTEPPAELEDAVVSALASRRLVAPGGSAADPVRPPMEPRVPARRVWAWAGLALAAGLAAFYAGLAVSDRGAGRGGDGTTPAGAAAPGRYLLLLYEAEAYRAPTTPAEAEARVAEYSAWAAAVHAGGVPIEGEELAPDAESRMLDGSRGEVVETAGAPRASAGTLSGYFLIEAPNAVEAVAVARTMPHLEYGGTVVVRPVVPH